MSLIEIATWWITIANINSYWIFWNAIFSVCNIRQYCYLLDCLYPLFSKWMFVACRNRKPTKPRMFKLSPICSSSSSNRSNNLCSQWRHRQRQMMPGHCQRYIFLPRHQLNLRNRQMPTTFEQLQSSQYFCACIAFDRIRLSNLTLNRITQCLWLLTGLQISRSKTAMEFKRGDWSVECFSHLNYFF